MNEELSPWYKYSLIALIAWMLPVLFLKFSGSLENLSFQSEAWEVLLPGVLFLLTFSILSASIRLPLKYYVLGLLVPTFQWYFYPEAGSYLPALFFIYLTFDHLQHRFGLRLILFATALLYPFTIVLLPLLCLNAHAAKMKNWYVSSPILSLMLGFFMSLIFGPFFGKLACQEGISGGQLEWSFGLLLGISLSMFIVLFVVHLKRARQFFLEKESSSDRNLLLYPLFVVIGSGLDQGTVSNLFDSEWLLVSLFPLLMVYSDSESRVSRMFGSILFVLISGGLFYGEMDWTTLLALGLGGVLFSFLWSMNRSWLTTGLLGCIWIFFFARLYVLLN
jgi:hypothetical protein